MSSQMFGTLTGSSSWIVMWLGDISRTASRSRRPKELLATVPLGTPVRHVWRLSIPAVSQGRFHRVRNRSRWGLEASTPLVGVQVLCHECRTQSPTAREGRNSHFQVILSIPNLFPQNWPKIP